MTLPTEAISSNVDPSSPEVVLVVGGLLDPHLTPEAAQHVKPEDFSDSRLRKVWATLVEMVEAGAKPGEIDVTSVSARIASAPSVRERIARFCGGLMDGSPRYISLVEAAKRVRRAETLRLALSLVRELSVSLKEAEGGGDVPDLEDRLAGLSLRVAERTGQTLGRSTFKDVAKEAAAYLDSLGHGYPPDAIRTGIHGLDRRLNGGLHPGQLASLIAMTGAGKTALASQIADYASYAGKSVVLFSLEMSDLDIYLRDIERIAGRSRWDLRAKEAVTREKSAEDLTKAQAAMLTITTPKVVYSEPTSIEGIRQAVLTERMRGGPVHLVVVDHAQVVAPSENQRCQRPRYLEVQDTAVGLRRLARSLNVAVLLTAQMNPPPKGEEPSMYLVRESKDVANSSDVVLLTWHERDEIGGNSEIVRSWIIVDKIRAGIPGKVPVRYEGRTFRFTDPVGHEAEVE